MALIRHIGQLAADMRMLYKWHREDGHKRWKAFCKTALCDGQTKAAAACMAVLCLAVVITIVLTFGPGGFFFNK